MVEVDEVQHFTSYRAVTLELLRSRRRQDLDSYRELCMTWSPKADRYRAARGAKGFPGLFGRSRQRAYNDLLRDLVAPAMGYKILRIPAPMASGSEAYGASAAMLRAALS